VVAKSITPSAILKNHIASVKRIVDDLHKIILFAVPDVIERTLSG
jgi:hypothetical protein